MTFQFNFNREENYLVNATLSTDGVEVEGVSCKLYLPERIYEKPYLVLKPAQHEAGKIFHLWKAALKARVISLSGETELAIDAPEVYFSNVSRRALGGGLSETTMPGEPQDLHIVQYIHGSKSNKNRTKIAFWISQNKTLTPSAICTTSYTGEVKYETVRNFEFTLRDGLKISFANHFRNKTEKNKNLIQWSYLVAGAELESAADDVESIKTRALEDVDDFLLLTSFATRHRTMCLGWTASDDQSLTTFYRGNYAFPKPEDSADERDEIVDIQHFQMFVERCYPTFSQFKNKLALRSALHATVTSKSKTIENSFLSLFAALETLVSDFRKSENMEFVLPEIEWKKLRDYLQCCIKKSSDPELISDQRATIYKKLNELNRVSLRDAFEAFCKKYSINLTDLWPIFSTNGILGLSDVRNKLIHGDPFPENLIQPLSIANENLRYTVERIVFHILRWEIENTNLSISLLRQNTNILNLHSAQTSLSTPIN
ncbi:hypothetical protein H8K32_14475 [Undibacterium jejuense]|uniref:ApeA N-terminal domain-containing protein n=1 Tax=Undibacterium jejuense TaxID=1344949 RepID=A0A923KQR1_9BURK|nr:hypothetical protein [Undibacterium jejuense]MBC3863309.1 hypothetical protein [Undibacterium jejuense]